MSAAGTRRLAGASLLVLREDDNLLEPTRRNRCLKTIMAEMFTSEPAKKGINPVFLVGILIGLLVIGVAAYLLTRKPTMEEQAAQIVATAAHEGSPEFADLSKDIII